MVIGHPHADSVAVLRETEPGVFEPGDEPGAFPMRVVVSVPEPGRIRHSWWYGRPGDIAYEKVAISPALLLVEVLVHHRQALVGDP